MVKILIIRSQLHLTFWHKNNVEKSNLTNSIRVPAYLDQIMKIEIEAYNQTMLPKLFVYILKK